MEWIKKVFSLFFKIEKTEKNVSSNEEDTRDDGDSWLASEEEIRKRFKNKIYIVSKEKKNFDQIISTRPRRLKWNGPDGGEYERTYMSDIRL